MTVRITRRADHVIASIFINGTARFGLTQTELYHDGLHQLFDLLDANPRMARLRMEFRPPVRLHCYRAHMVFYIDDEHGIEIVRVLHGRQDWVQPSSSS